MGFRPRSPAEWTSILNKSTGSPRSSKICVAASHLLLQFAIPPSFITSFRFDTPGHAFKNRQGPAGVSQAGNQSSESSRRPMINSWSKNSRTCSSEKRFYKSRHFSCAGPQISIGGEKMAGRVKSILEAIIEHRAKGNPTLVAVTKTKLILKGLNPDKYGAQTPDDPVVLKKVEGLARQLGLNV